MILRRIDYNGGDIWVAGDVDKNSLYFANQGVNICMDVRENSDYPFLNHQGSYDSKHWIKNKIYGQSPSLLLPNIPYVEIEENIVCPFCQGKMEATKEYLGNMFYLSCESEDYKCPAKNMTCDGEMGIIAVSMLTAKEVEDDAKRRLAASAKKYTEEDLRKVMLEYAKWVTGGVPSLRFASTQEEAMSKIIQSLKPKVVSIEVEMCSEEVHMNKGDGFKPYKIPVTYVKDGKTFVKVKKVNHGN